MTEVVGRRTRLVDWDERTSGATRYVSDVHLEGMLVGMILRSPHPHAVVRSVDLSAARSIPGVRAVVSAADLAPGTTYLHVGPPHADRPPLATDRVRFIGEEVAAVAAVDESTARRALDAIEVDYQPLDAPVDVESALGDGAPVLHDREAGPNLAVDYSGHWGDLAVAEAASAAVVEGTFRYPRSIHVCMERSTTIARWSGPQLELWTTTQAPWYVATEVAHALGLTPDQVVCHDIAVGGGFGARSKITEHEVVAALLARAADAPVRVELTREEEFSATKTRHRSTVTTRLHATSDGRICLVEGDLLYENGAYNHSGPNVLKVGVKTLGALYQPDAARWRARLVDTAVQPGGSFRGYGGPQVSFALESQVDELAAQLGLDPIEMRKSNANQPGSTALCGARIGSVRLVECLDEVREALDWDSSRPSPGAGRSRGRGVAAGMHGSGSHVGPGTEYSAASVEIDGTGRVTVRFGSQDTGTGQRTVCAQVAAEELGLDPSDVEVVMGHAADIPHDAGAWSSRGTHMAGHAVGGASRLLADRLRGAAAERLGGDAAAVHLAKGRAELAGSSIELADLVAGSADAADGRIREEYTHHETRMEMFGADNPTPNFSASYTFCAHGAEVEVDELTGRIRVIDYVAAHDVGRAINPSATEGQIIGGVVMALGAVLGEELVHEGGRTVNPSYLNYPLLRAADAPDVRAILVEGPEEAGPYDAKSVGEMPVYPVAAAVANAVADATGVRLRDLPFTPDKVLAALAERDGRSVEVRPVWRRPSRWWVAGIRALYPRGLHALLHRHGTRFARRRRPTVVRSIESPGSLRELVSTLADDRSATVVAGNTDLSLQRRQGLATPVRLLSTADIEELRTLEQTPSGALLIGASVTLSRLERELTSTLPMLASAAGSIASPQIRRVATLGGNLAQAKRCWFFRNGFECYKRGGVTCPCYAVEGDHRFQHAIVDGHRCQAVTPSDLATALAALDACVVIRGARGERSVPIVDLYSGPGELTLAADEVIVRVELPAAALRRRGAFVKLNAWEGDFAMVSAAISCDVDGDGRWRDVRVVLGAVAPTPYRLTAVEEQIEGRLGSAELVGHLVASELRKEAHPLARNGWKILGAEGVAVRAVELLESRQ